MEWGMEGEGAGERESEGVKGREKKICLLISLSPALPLSRSLTLPLPTPFVIERLIFQAKNVRAPRTGTRAARLCRTRLRRLPKAYRTVTSAGSQDSPDLRYRGSAYSGNRRS